MWEGEAIGAYAGHSEDFPVMVEPLECSLECIEGIFSENTLACDVAEIEECTECLCNVGRYITFESIYEDLVGLACEVIATKSSYLHQCSRVIACPLFEFVSLLEPLKAGKEGCQCNSVRS